MEGIQPTMNNEQIEFWNKLKRRHLDDIDKCLAINANYAATKTMLSFIDVLGSFYCGLIESNKNYYIPVSAESNIKKPAIINGKKYKRSGSGQCFVKFTKKYLGGIFKYKIKVGGKFVSASEILYNHFRCGMIHEGHSKYGTGIFRENLGALFIPDINGLEIALNILALRDTLRNATFNYENDLLLPKDPFIYERWFERYNYLTNPH